MAGTGVTISFLRKRIFLGDQIGCVVSLVASAVSWNISKNDLKIKDIDWMAVGARSFTSHQNIIRQNLRSGTTAEAGTLHGESFTIGDTCVLTIFGR